MKVILASQSPRRAALLDLANIDYEIIRSNGEKEIRGGENIEEQVDECAYEKAKDVFDNTQGDRAIIGADTVVIKNNKVYGKPKDRQDAIRMLKELQGGYHHVYTGLSVLIEERDRVEEVREVVKTAVKVAEMTDQEIIAYVDSEEPYDKAGSYAIQSSFARHIEKIEGNYMSVIGLPIDRVYTILKDNEVI